MMPNKVEDATSIHADLLFVERLKDLGITKTLNRLADLDPGADTVGVAVTFLKETGAGHVLKLFETAFPDQDI